MDDLKSNIQKAREKFNQRREQSESIFKTSSQILENDKKLNNNNLTIQENLKNHHEKKYQNVRFAKLEDNESSK